uniref:Uncharacterized protein n=1 Tax=Meloidogyne enterolobii TaxID=390850 RepID=A0A6V7WJA2_MELEN|nr:unnamed protein product [Meloidogyne enterolobii]
MYLVPDSQNFILHFRNWSMIDHDAINVPLINRVIIIMRNLTSII